MRRLSKGPTPQVLIDNEAQWTKELVALRAGDAGVPRAAETRYRHHTVRAAIVGEAKGKCVYCESSLTHAQPGDIEHFRPKSLIPELAFTWTNLLLACRKCNHAKGEYDNTAKPLVNPFFEDPDDFLRAFGCIVEGRDPQGRGMVTERACQLNRPDLLLWRSKAIQAIKPLVDLWKREQDPALEDAWKSQLIELAGDEAEYTMVVRAYLAHHGVM